MDRLDGSIVHVWRAVTVVVGGGVIQLSRGDGGGCDVCRQHE